MSSPHSAPSARASSRPAPNNTQEDRDCEGLHPRGGAFGPGGAKGEFSTQPYCPEQDGVKGKTAQAPCLPSTEAVVREYAPRVYGIAWRILGNAADAEDVTQDVLFQIVRRLGTFRGESALSTWLYRITVNAVLALGRKRTSQRERFLSDLLDPSAPDDSPDELLTTARSSAEEVALEREQRTLIERAIAALPPLYRETFVLSDVEGLPNAEIGGLLGLSLPAVKSRLHRARLLMRQALAPHFE